MRDYIEISDPRRHFISKGTPFTRLSGSQFFSCSSFRRRRIKTASSWRICAVSFVQTEDGLIPNQYITNIPGEGFFSGKINNDFVIEKDTGRLVFFGDLEMERW